MHPTGSYARPSYAPAPAALSTTRARPWLIGLAAMGTVLVLFLTINNSAVTDVIMRHAVESDSFGGRAALAISSFRWDLGRLGNDTGNLYLASLLTDIAVLVLVLLFVAAVTRGRGSFGHVFAGTWIAVIAAAMIANYLRPIVLDINELAPQFQSKATNIFFSVYSPSAATLFTAILYGLPAALIAGLVGVTTRRTDGITSPPVPGGAGTFAPEDGERARREPWSAPPAVVPGPVASPAPWSKDPSTESDDDADRTTQLPAVDQSHRPSSDGEQHTTELPRIEDERH